jgi:hypothetical protein
VIDWTYGAGSIADRGDTVHVTYRKFSRQVKKSGRCVCGKRRTRSATLTDFMSPFNQDETGAPKTPRQIQASLQLKAEKWLPDFTCTGHDYIAISAAMVGNMDVGFETVYGIVHRSPHLGWVQSAGTRAADGTDDFLIGVADGDRLITVLDAHGEALAGWDDGSYRSVADGIGMNWGDPS